MNGFKEEISAAEIAKAFGIPESEIAEETLEMINNTDLAYRKFTSEERDEVILGILEYIDAEEDRSVGAHTKEKWVKGWQENLDLYLNSNRDIEALVPKFLRPEEPIRWQGDYICPSNPRFEHDFYMILRDWLFRKYLSEFNCIYEYRAGTGFNLIALARLFPEKQIYGSDWVEPAVELINQIASDYKLRVEGRLFDFQNPDHGFEVAPNSAVLTFDALEQIGANFEAFLDYLMKNRPKLCIHVEPTAENYDLTKLFDYLAFRYHRKRNYLDGYLTRLRQLEQEQKIELLKVHRFGFGGKYHEGFQLSIWRPV